MMFSGGPSGLIPIITPAMLACKLHQPRTGDAVQLVWAMGRVATKTWKPGKTWKKALFAKKDWKTWKTALFTAKRTIKTWKTWKINIFF